ncbi:hypothetical protein [Roseiflexus castenholzii]|uniref:hypothetical protein n=1 Tax=Roseiflexus castenholzii TaxID=120962 RepID=UPI0000E76120|nr:hypothetical protein [Roseiflexus castenholzii]
MKHPSHSVELTGLTWDHTRGYVPLVAAAQRVGELHPGMTITCIALGETPFTTVGRVVDRPIGIAALEHLRALIALCDPACLHP